MGSTNEERLNVKSRLSDSKPPYWFEADCQAAGTYACFREIETEAWKNTKAIQTKLNLERLSSNHG
jgi:hypothetical protein